MIQPPILDPDHERNGPVDLVLDMMLFAPVGVMCCLPELASEVLTDPAHAFTHASGEGRRVIGATERRVEHRIRRRSEQVHRALEGLGLSWSLPSWLPAVPGLSYGQIQSESTTTTPMVTPVDESPPTADESSVPIVSAAASASDLPPVAEATLGITDYASLSASQVMPRLVGLTADELETLRHFELQNRGRKTILNKIAQLQQPAPSGA